jgi:hypothetical protein
VPPGSSLVEINLIDRDGGTLLRMTHSALPNAARCAGHDKGWTHYLGALAIAAAGRKPGTSIGARRRVTLSAIPAPSSSTAQPKS